MCAVVASDYAVLQCIYHAGDRARESGHRRRRGGGGGGDGSGGGDGGGGGDGSGGGGGGSSDVGYSDGDGGVAVEARRWTVAAARWG